MPDAIAPRVSVIIPTYNRADLLPRALESVFTQDYKDYELIVIDNGSTPETQAVIQQFDDPRLRNIRFDQNRGVGGARNEGVLLARGELTTFIDTDDIWLPGKLAYQVGLFQKYPKIELIFGNYRNINHLNREDKSGFDQTQDSLSMLQVRGVEAEVYQVLSGIPEAILVRSFFATPTVMLRSAVFKKIGNFNTSLSGPEDFEFWCRSALKGVHFAYTTRLLIDRHKDEKSLSSKTLLFLPHYLRALDICESTACQTGHPGLMTHFDHARSQTWLRMLHAYALEGQRQQALKAFVNHLQYGGDAQAFLYLAAALAGPRAISLAKRLLKHS